MLSKTQLINITVNGLYGKAYFAPFEEEFRTLFNTIKIPAKHWLIFTNQSIFILNQEQFKENCHHV